MSVAHSLGPGKPIEDSIEFDVWATAAAGDEAALLQFIMETRPASGRAEVLRAIKRASVARRMVVVTERRGWHAANSARGARAERVREVRVYPSGYGPDDDAAMRKCEEHGLYYAGVLGCPLCSGRFAP